MKININNSFGENTFIDLKDDSWLDNARKAGKIAAQTLQILENYINNKTKKTLIELNDIAEDFILKSGGSPTFKGYPSAVCISVNYELVHGIPKEYILKDGDLVSFDLGVTVNGAIADTAITCIYGLAKSDIHTKLVKTNDEALIKAIESIKVNKRIGVIGESIYSHIKSNGFEVIDNYGGHGISISKDGVGIPHSAPFISNKSNANEGVVIQPGLAIAIEPMSIIGNDLNTRVLDDGWTVIAANINCHVEHSIFIHNDHVEVLTWRDSEAFKGTNKFYFTS